LENQWDFVSGKVLTYHEAVDPIKAEGLSDLPRAKVRAALQRPIVPARNVVRIPITWPPAHETRGGLNADLSASMADKREYEKKNYPHSSKEKKQLGHFAYAFHDTLLAAHLGQRQIPTAYQAISP
jgi:hypothetical protein